MNALWCVILFVISFVLGAVVMAFLYAWHVTANDRVLAIDKKAGYCHFMDRLTFVRQEVIEINMINMR